jgi:hypothetical protein
LKRYETIELQSKSLREKIAGLEKECGEQQASQSTPISNFSHRPWKLKDLVKLANELEKSVGELESDLKG